MKREYKSELSYIDWLKSLGCIAYLPLSNNDFTEYISGNTAFNSEVASNRRNYVPMLRKLDNKPGLLDLEGSICSFDWYSVLH